MPLNAACGLSPQSTDNTREVSQKELKETSFVWLEPADSTLVRGIAQDDKISPVCVPAYIWPKGGSLGKDGGLVGLGIHGGSYMMGNAGESFGESNIPRSICKVLIFAPLINFSFDPGDMTKNSKIQTVLSVDYRLAGEACHPGQLLDALAAYSHLVKTLETHPSRIVVFGACAGGIHLIKASRLVLMRYLYEEKVLPLPAAMMLFSPWVDMAIDQQMDKDPLIARPNTTTDMLATSYQANLLFLGHHSPDLLSTPYMSANLAPPKSYTNYPKTFISVGDAEAFQRECDQLADLLHTDGVDVTRDVQVDAVHDFWIDGLDIPSNAARARLAKHVYECIEGLTTTETT